LSIYVTSGLGLLLVTSFLGLRRYLRQRKLQMPPAMTARWLGIGIALIVLLLLAGIFLPRPNAEYSVVSMGPFASSQEREASRFAIFRDSSTKGNGAAGNPQAGNKSDGQGGAGKSGDRQSGPSEGQRNGESGSNQGQSSSGQSQGDKGSGQGKGDNQSGSGQNQGDQRSGESKGGNQKGSGQDRGDQRSSGGESQNQTKSGQNRSDSDKNQQEKSDGEKKGGGAGEKSNKEGSGGARRSSDAPPSPSRLPDSISSFFHWLAPILKWVLFGIIAAIVAFVVFRGILKFLANFTSWARGLLAAIQGLWESLFGWIWRTGQAQKLAVAQEQAPRPQPRPFASFRNPFRNGGHQGSPEELVQYSFEAMEAWAWEHGQGRQPEETALEFAGRLGQEVPGLETESRKLAALYARAAYARGRLALSSVDIVRQFWQQLEAVQEAPLSA
jgi:hypothetical protein